MKNFFSDVLRHSRQSFAPPHLFSGIVLILVSMVPAAFLLAGCQKQMGTEMQKKQQPELSARSSNATMPGAEFMNMYSGLSSQNSWELQQARAATARYRNIKNALKDGYVDIEVDVEHMGHHFLKEALLDATFDFRQPEILVYNKNDAGEQELVALEYAAPLTASPPSGYSGNDDEWTIYENALWTLHAWVWAYNPDGVFNPTNPLVHLH